MIEAIIQLLIYVCIVALVIYIIIWVIETLTGTSIPGKIKQILWMIFALIVLLMLVRLVLGMGGIPHLMR